MRDGATVDATDTFTWTVTNVNGNPTFDQNVPNQTNAEGALVNLDAGATDPDADALTYAATGLPAGLSIDTSTGLISGTIAFNAAAGSPYSVSVTVSDNPPTVDATDTFTWTVTNVNREPTFDQNVPDQTNAEGALISLDAGATDLDGDALIYAATNLPPGLSINTSTGLISGTIAFTASATPYNVSVTVRDGATVDATDTFSWTVTNVNREPTFDQDVLDRTDAEGALISLDAGATDLDGDALIYAATNLPAGLSINTGTGLISGTIASSAAASSPYSVSVTVRDGATVDATDTFTWTVTNVNGNPTFDQNVPNQTNAEGALVNLDAGATDPDADALTYAATGLPAGLSIDTSTGLISGTIAFNAAAGSPYSVSVTVSDNPPTVDATDTFTWTVTNVNREPTFDQNVPDQTNAEGALISLDAGATDLDGDALIYAATNLPPGLSINTSTGLISGTIAFTASATPYNVSVTVRDGATVDATDTFSWTVTNVNREPTFDQDVLDRTDAEGALISLDAGATDLDGDALIYAATNLPAGLSINTGTGLISGTIASSAAASSPYSVSVTVRDGATVDATDTFTWTVTDATAPVSPVFRSASYATNNATVTTLAVPRPAAVTTGDLLLASIAIRGTSTMTAPAGWTLIRNDVSGNNLRHATWWRFAAASDPSSWTWTFSAGRLAAGAIHAYGGVAASNPIDTSSGSANASSTSLTATGVTTTAADDLLVAFYSMTTNATITPPAGMTERGEQAGSAPGRTTVLEGSDAALGAAGPTGARVATASRAQTSIGQLIALRPAAGGPPPVNNEPTFDQNVPDQTNAEGAVINLDAGATDLDGDPLTYAATGLPAGLSIDTSTGLISGTIAFTAAASSPYSVSVTVRDGATVDATDTFQWTVMNVNREPTFDQNLGNRTDVEGAVISLDAGATDPDGDPLIYAATNLPPGLSISPTTGLITGTIDATAAAGSPYSVSITVRDGPTVDATDTFTWTVTDVPPPNQPPTFDQDLGSRTDAEGAVITLDAGATDPEGDPLTYAATGLPAGLSIDTSTGLITGTIAFTAAAGSPYNVSVTVRDGPTVDATDTFQWTITNVNREPTFDQNLPNRTDPEGAVINLDAGATDLDGDPLTYAATGLPAGLSINTSTGLITGTISSTAAASSPYSVSITVRDGATVDATDTFTWTVTDVPGPNQPPTFDQNLPNRTDPEGAVINLDAGATDPDGDPLTYAATNLPPGLSINTGTGLITGTIGSTAAAGSPYSVSITVSDSPPGVDATDTFTWTVTDVPPGSGIAFRAVSFGSNNASTTSINLARPTGTLTGDVMLALLDVRGTSTVTAPAGWTLIRTDTYTASLRMHAYWRVATASDPTSWTWTFSGSRLAAGAIHAYSGVDTANPIDASGGAPAPAASATATAPSITTTVPNTMLVAFFANLADSTWTAPAGFTERADLIGTAPTQFTSLLSADALRPATGATGPVSAAASKSSGNAAQLIALRPASGGPPPVNNEPTFDQNLPNRTDPEGAVINLDAGATDLDGDPLTYAATGLPAGLSINTSTGLITGTISSTAAASSPYSVSITVRDGATVDATDTFTWTVTDVPGPNQPPTFDQNLPNRTDPEGAVINLDAGATDPDGDPLTYAATNLPPGLSINTGTGLITGTIGSTAAAGSPYSVSITVSDSPPGVDATDTFTWTVTDVPPGSGIAFRAVSFGSNNASTTSINLARPTGTLTGDVMLALLDVRGTSTVTAPAGWTLIRTDTYTASLRMHAYWRVATASDPTSWTWTFSGSRLAAGAIHAYSGVDTANPIDASGGAPAPAASATATAPSITTTVPNTMLVAFFANLADSTWTAPAGFTERADLIGTAPTQFTSLLSADALRPATGATGPVSAAASKSSGNAAQLIALRPA